MTSAYEYSPPKTCRVQPEWYPMQLNKGTILRGYRVHVTPEQVAYRSCGMTVSDFNRGLRLPQMRTFLGPEYFNAGCSPLYCKDSAVCPQSRPAEPGPHAEALFQTAFETPFDPNTGNDLPPSCFGTKCNSYNSAMGWEVTPSKKLRWQQ